MRQSITIFRLYLNEHLLGEISIVDGKPLFRPAEYADLRLDDIEFIRDELTRLQPDDDIPF